MDQPRTAPPRPYFLPAGIDYQTLPQEVQAALNQIIQPAYFELVVLPKSALERAAGTSIVFLMVEELLQQFEIGRQMDLTLANTTKSDEREQEWQRHLKLVSAKQSAVNGLLRLRKSYPPPLYPLPRPPQ